MSNAAIEKILRGMEGLSQLEVSHYILKAYFDTDANATRASDKLHCISNIRTIYSSTTQPGTDQTPQDLPLYSYYYPDGLAYRGRFYANGLPVIDVQGGVFLEC
ncbi:hypothetical protein HK097_004747 [Rhizophlyctis rosea]|uniref:Uncharacterized protein n=1 Tax=Rhizophlyctis rosea TaxID=64517 RepID=A0AAD5X5R9_9FUNG|nr:hypothetical protein HK097_004747 [Rhizophlyctis rosea]